MAEKNAEDEFIHLPISLFREIANNIEEKALFEEEERYFKTMALITKIVDRNKENVFLMAKEAKVLRKLYDAERKLPI